MMTENEITNAVREALGLRDGDTLHSMVAGRFERLEKASWRARGTIEERLAACEAQLTRAAPGPLAKGTAPAPPQAPEARPSVAAVDEVRRVKVAMERGYATQADVEEALGKAEASVELKKIYAAGPQCLSVPTARAADRTEDLHKAVTAARLSGDPVRIEQAERDVIHDLIKRAHATPQRIALH